MEQFDSGDHLMQSEGVHNDDTREKKGNQLEPVVMKRRSIGGGKTPILKGMVEQYGITYYQATGQAQNQNKKTDPMHPNINIYGTDEVSLMTSNVTQTQNCEKQNLTQSFNLDRGDHFSKKGTNTPNIRITNPGKRVQNSSEQTRGFSAEKRINLDKNLNPGYFDGSKPVSSLKSKSMRNIFHDIIDVQETKRTIELKRATHSYVEAKNIDKSLTADVRNSMFGLKKIIGESNNLVGTQSKDAIELIRKGNNIWKDQN